MKASVISYLTGFLSRKTQMKIWFMFSSAMKVVRKWIFKLVRKSDICTNGDSAPVQKYLLLACA